MFEIEGVQVFDLKEVSERLGIGVRAIREYIKDGDLPARKIGRKYFVTSDNFLSFIKKSSKRGIKAGATQD